MECYWSWVAVGARVASPRSLLMLASVLLGRRELTALLDSGSAVSMICTCCPDASQYRAGLGLSAYTAIPSSW